MIRILKPTLTILGLGCAAAILAHFTSPTASAVAPIPVQVTNTRNAPAYVDDERPARNGFGATCGALDVDPSSGEAQCTLLTLSPGQEVVIETVSCAAAVAAGSAASVTMFVTAPAFGGGTVDLDHAVPFARTGGDSTFEKWSGAGPLRVYAVAPSSASSTVGVFFATVWSGAVRQDFSCSIAGYTVS